MFKKRLIKSIGQERNKKLMIIRSQEKWRPIGLKGASGRASDPQGISRTIFGLMSQIIKTGV